MPIDLEFLIGKAHQAYQRLLKHPGDVKGGRFIGHFQDHAVHELERLELPPPALMSNKRVIQAFSLRTNRTVLGAYFPKELDVFLEGTSSGPLLGISFKCMMSGVAKNVNNRWEELVGDASNLHSRYPMLSLGYVMVLPAKTRREATPPGEEVVDANGAPTDLGRQIEAKLRGITGRHKPVELPTTYEEVALVVIDFEATAPKLPPTFPGPELRIETFYQRLVARFRERNHYLPWRGSAQPPVVSVPLAIVRGARRPCRGRRGSSWISPRFRRSSPSRLTARAAMSSTPTPCAASSRPRSTSST